MAKKYRIMVVDDDAETVKLIKEILRDENYTVIGASNGKECLEKLKKTRVDLVLLDVMMPDMHGKAVLDKIRKKDKVTKIALLTVLYMPSVYMKSFGLSSFNKVEMHKAGICDFINKPFTTEDFIKRVKAILFEDKV